MKKLPPEIKVFLDALPEGSPEKKHFLDKIKKYSTECGCALGARFLLFSTVLFSFYIFFSKMRMQISGRIFIFLGLIFLISLSGKLIGILMARIRLQRLYKRMIKNITI